jgi:Chaperone of endosialidase
MSTTNSINNTITSGNFTVPAGTITSSGNISTTAGNLLLPTTSSTVGQIQQNGVTVFHTYGSYGCFLGSATAGGQAGNFTQSGVENTGIGWASCSSLTNGANNTGVGAQTLQTCANGAGNCAIGVGCLQRLTSGSGNCCMGLLTGTNFTNNAYNVAIGHSALTNQGAGGVYNVAIGYAVGGAYTTSESSNILIMNNGVIGESNKIRIGTAGSGAGQQNACFIAGITGVTVGASGIPVVVDNAGQLGTVVSSIRYKENVHDMGSYSDDIMKLRPVTYSLRADTLKTVQPGLIAEEVSMTMPSLVSYGNDGIPMSVKYQDLIPLLLNEIQKLNGRITDLESKLGKA